MKTSKPVLSLALGGAFALTAGVSPVVGATDNPFAMQSLDKGYMVAAEGKCGGMKKGAEGKCGGMK
jgi:uncharacterized membrane protein